MFSMLRTLMAALVLAAPAIGWSAVAGPGMEAGFPNSPAGLAELAAAPERASFELAQAVDDPPAVQLPPTDAPSSDTPDADAPSSDAPDADAPVSDAPSDDMPAAGAPLADAFAPEAPVEGEVGAVGQQVLEFGFEDQSAEAAAEAEEEAVPSLLDTEVFNRRVTLDFKNADIQNVIRLIAARTGLNILLDPSEVEGRITLSLDNVPLRDALDNILKVNKLAYIIETGNILRIVPEGRVGRDKVETQTVVVELNWRDAKDVAATFKPFLTVHGDIRANEETQTVIVTDVPPNLIKVQDLIAQIDRPDRQVIIQTRLVDINEEQGRDLNTQLALRKNRLEGGETRIVPVPESGAAGIGGPFGFNQYIVPGVTVEGFSVAGGLGTLGFGSTIGILGDDYDLDAVLRVLEREDVVQVLASPRVTTLNNIPASIEIKRDIPYQENIRLDAGSTLETFKFKEATLKINVRPLITPSKTVRLDISLKQDIERGRVSPVGLAPPIIDTRIADSTVIVADRNTVVIGGLRQLQASQTTRAVPWVNRVPILGWLFKDRNNNSQKTNLVLMVTPEIVDEAVVTDVEQELYNRLDDEWDMPDYFLDDLSEMSHAK